MVLPTKPENTVVDLETINARTTNVQLEIHYLRHFFCNSWNRQQWFAASKISRKHRLTASAMIYFENYVTCTAFEFPEKSLHL